MEGIERNSSTVFDQEGLQSQSSYVLAVRNGHMQMNKDQIVQSSQSSQEAESIEVGDNSGAQNLVFSPIRTRSH